MKDFYQKIQATFRYFTIFDMGIFKTCLISIGIILGIYFKDTLQPALWLFWTLFILSWLYIMFKIFGVYWSKTS